MPVKKSFFISMGLIAGYLFINNASAGNYSAPQLAVAGLKKNEQMITRTADTTLRDAESALVQARHILVEEKNNPGVSNYEVKQLKQLVKQAALNLQRTQEIAGRIEGFNSQV